MSPPPLVTGIAPKEGLPGTKVTIRGENLGKNYEDLIAVKICGVDCTLSAEWISDKKIIAYTGLCKGKGDVVVVTHSGGVGSSSVGFAGLIKKNIGPTDETAVWIEEDPKSIITGLKKASSNGDIIDNPLGIFSEDSSHITSEYLEKEFANSTGDIRKENFSSIRFLLENYQNAKFKDLKNGLEFLRSNAASKTINSSDALLKSNISSFMDAIKILKNVYGLSAEDKRNKFCKPLETMLHDILKAAHKIYDQDLELKDKADIIRNSLGILNEYEFVFAFPQTIEKCLKKDDYEPIISGYKSVKLILAKADNQNSQLFKQIKIDVDKKIELVKKTLLEKLIQFPCNPDEQKMLIDYLYNIGFNDFDLGWYCLEQEKQWIIQLIIQCRDMHIADEKVSLVMRASDKEQQHNDEANNANNSNVSINNGNANSNNLNSSNTNNQNNNNNTKKENIQPHERNKFIEELCEMILDLFTDYWRLGNIYLQRLLVPKINDNKIMPSKNKTILQPIDITNNFKLHSTDEFYYLVKEILITFSNIVRAAFIPHTTKQFSTTDEKYKQLLIQWPVEHDAKITSQILPHCLRVCRMCASQIHALELPLNLFETLQDLIYDLRCECLKILLMTPTHEILSKLGFEEQDWVIDRDPDIGAYTNMPIRFETIFLKYLTLIKEFVLDDKKGEKMLFKDHELINKTALLIYGVVHAFLKRIRQFMTREDNLPQFIQITRNKMLLYLNNNLLLCMQKILPNIWSYVRQHNYKQIDPVTKETAKNVKELQEALINQYKIETIKPMITNIETNLYIGKYDFSDSSPPTTVRNYIKLIIINLISVHSELFTINKTLINNVLSYAVNELYKEIYRLLSTVPRFSSNSAMQTYIDIFCLKETLKSYSINNETDQLIKNILQLIPNDSFQQNKGFMAETINEFQAHMNPYILVLQQNITTL